MQDAAGQVLHTVLFQLDNNRLSQYCNTIALAMLVYDYLLTLGQEVDLIWSTPWSFTKILFFLTRYSAFLDASILTYQNFAPPNTFPSTCTSLYVATRWLMVWGIAIAEVVLAFRTWVLWGKNRYLGGGLFFLWFAMAGTVFIISNHSLGQVKFKLSPDQRIQSCWLPQLPRDITWAVDFTIVAVFESVMLGLTMHKGSQYLRHSRSNLVTTLYRDGILYYIYLMGVSLVNVITLAINVKPGLSLVLIQRVLHSILTGRILLNLRESAKVDYVLAVTDENTLPHVGRSWSQGTRLSSVILGENTWFCDQNTSFACKQNVSVDV